MATDPAQPAVSSPAPPRDAPPPQPNRKYLRATLAGGAGGLIALLFFLLEQHPELAQFLLERVVVAWGPQFVIVLILLAFLYLLADRYAPRLIRAQSETALALQDLARSVEQLAGRDDSFRREQDVLLNHVARRLDALHALLQSHHETLNGCLERWQAERNMSAVSDPRTADSPRPLRALAACKKRGGRRRRRKPPEVRRREEQSHESDSNLGPAGDPQES